MNPTLHNVLIETILLFVKYSLGTYWYRRIQTHRIIIYFTLFTAGNSTLLNKLMRILILCISIFIFVYLHL